LLHQGYNYVAKAIREIVKQQEEYTRGGRKM